MYFIKLSLVSSLAFVPLSACAQESVACQTLVAEKEVRMEVPDQLAIDMLVCLGNADPELRDGFAFETYVDLLREDKVSVDTVKALRVSLSDMLAGPVTSRGFQKPFAAIVLSEVARVDRVSPLFTEEERQALVDTASGYMASISDYRGFDQEQGWRHGIAHTADLMMQLTLNSAITPEQMSQMRDALTPQIHTSGVYAYTYGEPDRLARPIMFMIQREAFSEDNWKDWFTALAAGPAEGEWNNPYREEKQLRQLHNVKAFTSTIYINLRESEAFAPYAMMAREAYAALP